MKAIRCTQYFTAAVLALSVFCLVSGVVLADEGGVSFWLPGQYGSLAATPSEPGWSLPILYYHFSADASGSKNLEIGGSIAVGVDGRGDMAFFVPTYTFAKPLWKGQAALSLTGLVGDIKVAAEATLTGPGGGVLAANPSDSLTSAGDLYPSASLRWNQGNHNSMAYTMLGIPVGSYEVGRLANLGTNHWSVDTGGGYTYLDGEKGREASVVAGLTYNLENPDTDYQNGVDSHLDWGASQFLSEKVHVGLVGYAYYQISGDSGSGARLGDFKSRVYGIGPQVGFLFPIGGRQAYLSIKGYHEFDAKNRLEGWNTYLTLVLPLGPTK